MKRNDLVTKVLMILATTLASSCSTSRVNPQVVPTLPVVINDSGIIAEGRVEPIRFVGVGINTAGYIADVLSHEGDLVTAGQIIAHMNSTQAQTLEEAQSNAALDLSDAYQAVRDEQRKLDEFMVPRVLAGMTPQVAVRDSLDKLNNARAVFEQYRDASRKAVRFNRRFPALPPRILFDTNEFKGLPREYKKQVDVTWVNYRKAVEWVTLVANLKSAQARLAQAQTDYASLQDSSFGEKTAGVRAAVATGEVRSPFAGTITNMDLKVGEYKPAGTTLLTVADLSSWVIKTTNLTEIDVVNVKEGALATLTLDALPGVTLRGKVLSVARNYTERQGDIVYEVTVLISDKNSSLRWGMTSQVKFEE